MKKTLRNYDGLIVISAILCTVVILSVLNLIVFSYGTHIEKIEVTKTELKSGESSVIKIWIRNNEPEHVGILRVKTTIISENQELIVTNKEISIKSLSKFSTSNPVFVEIQADDQISENNHKINIILINNEHEIDRKEIYLKTIS
jgi:hypothetical protein